MSPRKKKTDAPVDELKIDFTGRMVIVLELEDYGPMEIGIDDKDAVLAVVRAIIDRTDSTMTVNSYSASRARTLRRLLEPLEPTA